MSGWCDGDCHLIASVVRDMGRADDEELAEIQAAVRNLIGKHEARMGGHLVTALCRWSEAAAKHQRQRAAAKQATVTQLSAKTSQRAG
jgi:hypothetical protein